MWGEGEFADCRAKGGGFDESVCGGEMPFCLNAAADIAACSYNCEMPCDCPQPPAGFEGAVNCTDVTGDMAGDCIIECGDADECPEGMFCYQGTACLFGEPEPGLPPYGDCLNDGPTCEMATCVTDPDMTLGWCAEACADANDDASCSAAPKGTATPDCIDISGMGDFFCALNCEDGECPAGMTCLGGNLPICIWEPMEVPTVPAPAYGDCANNPDATCLAEETCLEDDGGAVCTETCTMASDCGDAPETGDAVVACDDLGAGDTCYLDCSGGQTCPDGMECLGDSYCHWAGAGFLLNEDFEEGTFVPGWTLADVDGRVAADQVDFVTAAWVVGAFTDMDGNNAAYSTSYYTPAGASDDWMISPQITPSATSQLSWVARAPDEDFPDGYEVRVSTLTADPDDFMIEPVLFTVAGEEPDYTAHMVDLSAYDGVPIYLAWRNTSNDQFLLLVDNIQVTE